MRGICNDVKENWMEWLEYFYIECFSRTPWLNSVGRRWADNLFLDTNLILNGVLDLRKCLNLCSLMLRYFLYVFIWLVHVRLLPSWTPRYRVNFFLGGRGVHVVIKSPGRLFFQIYFYYTQVKPVLELLKVCLTASGALVRSTFVEIIAIYHHQRLQRAWNIGCKYIEKCCS